MQSKLRPYQQDIDRKIRVRYSAGERRIMVMAPTGAGKTKSAAHLITQALEKGKRVAFTVPYISLIDQTCQSMEEEGLRPFYDFGVIQGLHPLMNTSAPLQICSLETLARRKVFPPMDVVLVDEAHRMNKHLFRWMNDDPDRVFLGLSATPWTRGLGQHWESLIVGVTTQNLIDQGYLSDFRVFAPSSPDLKGVRSTAGDYNQKDLGERVSDKALVASITDTWIKHGRGRPTICYAVNRAHAKQIQLQFQAEGISAGYVDAKSDLDEREALRKSFHDGSISVVCNVGVLVAGVDWDVRCIILATPTKSEIKFVQMVGRGLRTAEGKDYCLILDHSDTHNRLGFVADIHHLTLDDGKKRENKKREIEIPLPKPCSKCSFVKPPKVSTCPSCGFKPEAQANVEHEAGQLVELSSGRKLPAKKTYTREEKEDLWAQLMWIANERGYSAGWVYHKCRELCGSKPKNQNVPPRPPTEATRKWVLSRQIAYSKRTGARSRAS